MTAPKSALGLPSRPNLEHLSGQAKTLQKAIRDRDAAALHRLTAHHPRFPSLSETGSARLADAQLVIARELGFPSWPKLKSYVESISGAKAHAMRPFRAEIEYFEDRANGLIDRHRDRAPHAATQVRASHPAFAARSNVEILDAALSLDDALFVIAREHGFADWSSMKRALRSLRSGVSVEPFREAFRAIEAGDNVELERRIRLDGSLVTARGTNGNTLLNLSIACRNLPAARLLIESGADANVPNVNGWTPLHQAAYTGAPDVVAFLLDARADPTVEALGEGGTPLVVSLFWGHSGAADVLAGAGVTPLNLRVAAGLGRVDVIETLFAPDGALGAEAGAKRGFYRPHTGFPRWSPANDPDEILNEAFVWAAKSGRTEALDFLLRKGASIDADPYRGSALLWVASMGSRLGAARWLLDHGASVNRRSTFGGLSHGEGITAMHQAASSGGVEMVELLMTHGADPSIKDGIYNSDAYGWANHFGKSEVIAYLASKGFGPSS